MTQIAKNLTDVEDGFLKGKRYVLMDRDGAFCPAFREILKNEGAEPVLLPPQSPNLNAHLERFHRSLKEECLERMIFFGETALRNAIRECVDHHYRHERNHQGLANKIIDPGDEVGRASGQVKCRERLGGLLRYHYPEANGRAVDADATHDGANGVRRQRATAPAAVRLLVNHEVPGGEESGHAHHAFRSTRS